MTIYIYNNNELLLLLLDDMEGPEYARLRICIDDFKHSIQLYP